MKNKISVMSLRSSIAGLVMGMGCTFAAPALAADTASWPEAGKTITVIVPFPAGSGSDSLARRLGQEVTKQTGVPVVIDNRPGGSTVIGAQHVARAQPDGYTLLYTVVVTHTQNPHLVKDLPYDPFKDFTPVLQLVRSATVLSANKDTPFDTTKELIAYAKANPGKLNFGSYSTGSTSHLNGEILKQEADIDIVHVPYKGTADASRALLAGEVQIYFDGTATAVEKWKGGMVKLLGPATDKRLSVLPDLPTLEEQGLPGLNIVGWQGLFAPGDVQPEVAEQVASVFRKVLQTPDIVNFIESGGNEVSGAGPDEYAKIVRNDYERWGKVIKSAGITLE
ncbi:tripartite tricarboxylate transporter substrate binding protein [Pusillimonas sp. MFBS29]|uniref:Bug family tripartite tricarboxylate transporter substrate binding protein n=1 Tax=Pusillimonas sp. MFBS29 TaxID=2886690 RepID=UPI001D11CB08|nr:tripartite tricarboxylate transporter substrate binding protein [Pusillimonas sp. MFBS29]MCC2597103.1 tripartite tricarboxylate transporter substrate binding protein [Pusillimonas sp. MFBS29]